MNISYYSQRGFYTTEESAFSKALVTISGEVR